jgi:hypothetical protein
MSRRRRRMMIVSYYTLEKRMRMMIVTQDTAAEHEGVSRRRRIWPLDACTPNLSSPDDTALHASWSPPSPAARQGRGG